MVLYFSVLKQIFCLKCQENVIHSHGYLERSNWIAVILPFKERNILSFNLPTLIHFLGSMLSSCAHSWKSLSGWLVCLFDTCCMKDFHLAKIKSWKPDFVEVEHQKMWFFYSLHPLCNHFATFWFAGSQKFLNQPFCYVPLVKEVSHWRLTFSDPFGYSSVSVGNKSFDCNPCNPL